MHTLQLIIVHSKAFRREML